MTKEIRRLRLRLAWILAEAVELPPRPTPCRICDKVSGWARAEREHANFSPALRARHYVRKSEARNPNQRVRSCCVPLSIWISVFLWHSSFGLRHYPRPPRDAPKFNSHLE